MYNNKPMQKPYQRVAIIGPTKSGKSFVAKNLFPNHTVFSLSSVIKEYCPLPTSFEGDSPQARFGRRLHLQIAGAIMTGQYRYNYASAEQEVLKTMLETVGEKYFRSFGKPVILAEELAASDQFSLSCLEGFPSDSTALIVIDDVRRKEELDYLMHHWGFRPLVVACSYAKSREYAGDSMPYEYLDRATADITDSFVEPLRKGNFLHPFEGLWNDTSPIPQGYFTMDFLKAKIDQTMKEAGYENYNN